MKEDKITELLSNTLNQVDDLRKQFATVTEHITAVNKQNDAYRRTILNIEKQILELRLSEFGSSLVQVPTPVCTSGYLRVEPVDNSLGKVVINDGIEEIKSTEETTYTPEELDELFDSTNENPEVVEIKQEPVIVKTGKKRGRPKKSTTDGNVEVMPKVLPKLEVGGTVFKEFEELNVDNIAENSKKLSAYTASEDEIKEIKEENKHPNKLGALEAFFSKKEKL